MKIYFRRLFAQDIDKQVSVDTDVVLSVFGIEDDGVTDCRTNISIFNIDTPEDVHSVEILKAYGGKKDWRFNRIKDLYRKKIHK